MAFQLAEAYVQLSQRGLGRVSGAIGAIGQRLKGLINPMNMVASGLGAIGAGVGVGAMIGMAAKTEKLAVSFEVLLGSAGKAKRMMQEINRFAAKTPYEQQELAGVAKQFLAFGVAQENVIPTMTRLGDIAALSGARIGDLARIFGKVKGTGRLMTETLDQFLERGIPLGRELAKMFGVTEAKVREMASAGAISFKDFQTALANLTRQGGQFGGGMAKLSGTIGGLWSTFTGNMKVLLGQIGQAMIDAFDLKGVVGRMGEFVANFNQNYGERIKQVFRAVRDFAVEAWGRISGVVGQAIATLTGHAADFGGILSGLMAIGLGLVDVLAGVGRVLVTLLGPVLSVAGAIGRWIADNTQLIATIGKVVGIVLGLVVAIKAAIAVVGAIGAALAFLTTPIGLVVAAVGVLGYVFRGFFGKILRGLAAVIRDWDIYWRLAWEHTKLFLANTWERIKAFFVNIGRVLKWLWDVWKSTWITIKDFLKAVVINLGKNVANLAKAIWGALTFQGWDFDWTPLTEGFKATVAEWPGMAEAKVKESNDRIRALQDKLARRKAARAAEEAKQEREAAEKAALPAPGEAKEAAPEPGTIKMARRTQAEKAAAGEIASAPGAVKAGPGAGADRMQKAGFSGLAEMAKKMQEAAFRRMKDKDEADAAKRTAKATQDLANTAKGEGIKVRSDAPAPLRPAPAVYG